MSARDPLVGVTRLQVTATQKDRPAVMAAFVSESSTAPLAWPVQVTLRTTELGPGDTVVEGKAFDATRTEIARGATSVTLPKAGVVSVELICESLACATSPDASSDAVADAAAAPDGGDPDAGGEASQPPGAFKCGNGVLDPDETCDTAIPSDLPGACPQTCDDAIPCTLDRMVGSACTATCTHTEITDLLTTDGCCPAGATHGTDSDCALGCGNGRVDPGESCDTGIAAPPGVCPTVDSCDDGDPCTTDRLISANTCAAACSHTPITSAVAGDGCCPVGADAVGDVDCPAACGNGIVEPGESCDTAIAEGGPTIVGACPSAASCNDGNPCTADVIVGSGCNARCQHSDITIPAPGDGCCPGPVDPGHNVDPDCAPVCGNGVLEAGETCDPAIPPGTPGSCPSACPAPPVACVVYRFTGASDSCTAACEVQAITSCSATADGCCPTGCGSASDPDCPATCGNGVLDAGETCDVAIGSGPGSCPRGCSDGVPCTDDILIDGGSCTARCLFLPTVAFRNGDGCCPAGAGANSGLDSDCPASCGNGVVELPWETCDTGTSPPSCSATCPPADSCAPYVALPSSSACDQPCARRPITACVSGDGCCPAGGGCTAGNDADCGPRCGDGVVSAGETCDRGITAGHDGACAASCADADPCTLDFTRGSRESCDRVCSHVRITTCGAGDRCCPSGCTAETDADCVARCGDGIVEAQETCDPPSSCPGSCADDGDACTLEQLVGAASTCDASCRHIPILRCSGTVRDGCCPSGCTPSSDIDC